MHADLQHDALPNLIKMFPRVQFIVTSHAPLFPLGMQKIFGDEGFTLLELPSGTRIDAERFCEFERSFAYFQETKTFEDKLRAQVSTAGKPLILCEGETDPTYLKTAAELLGFKRLASDVDFDWVGQETAKGAVGGGKDNLDNAFKFLMYNPEFLARTTVLLYDPDTNKTAKSIGNLHTKVLPHNPENTECLSGIEILLPECVFEERFYKKSEKRTADKTTVHKLQKKELCSWLCEKQKDKSHFEKFCEPLSELERLLFPEQTDATPSP